jgi:hypothetical protein
VTRFTGHFTPASPNIIKGITVCHIDGQTMQRTSLLVRESPACLFETAGMNLADFHATLVLFPNSVNMRQVKI